MHSSTKYLFLNYKTCLCISFHVCTYVCICLFLLSYFIFENQVTFIWESYFFCGIYLFVSYKIPQIQPHIHYCRFYGWSFTAVHSFCNTSLVVIKCCRVCLHSNVQRVSLVTKDKQLRSWEKFQTLYNVKQNGKEKHRS